VSACAEACRPDLQWGKARGSPGPAERPLESGDQPQDCEGARPDDPAVGAGAGGPGHRVIDRRVFLCGMTLGTLAAPLAVEAQPAGNVYRIGYLSAGSIAANP